MVGVCAYENPSTQKCTIIVVLLFQHQIVCVFNHINVEFKYMLYLFRSSEDLYTPPSQVEAIQEEVVTMLFEVFPARLILHQHYQDKQPDDLHLAPS